MRRGYRGLPHSLHEQASKRVGDSEEGKMEGGLGEVGGGGAKGSYLPHESTIFRRV